MLYIKARFLSFSSRNHLLRLNMSESPRRTSGDFAKKVQRQFSRGKEKVKFLQDVLSLMLYLPDTLTFFPSSSYSAGSTEAGKDCRDPRQPV